MSTDCQIGNDAENAIVGSVLKEPETFELLHGKILPKHFKVSALKIIWTAICDIKAQGAIPEYNLMGDYLEKAGKLKEVGNRSYLIALRDGVASTANIEEYARIVIERFISDQIIDIGNRAGHMIQEGQKSAEVMAYYHKAFGELDKEHYDGGYVHIATLLPEVMARIDQISTGKIKTVMTGYTDLDYKIGGMEMGDLMVISGLESSGKTSLAFNMAEHISLKENIPVGIFAVEGTNHKTVTRFLCSLAKVNYLHIKNKLMSDSDWERLTRASETMQNMRIYIDDASTIGPMTIKSTMMRMNQKHGVQVFIIDYLQKINLKSESRRIEITKIIQALKAAAEELNSIVIAISTAVRTKEARRDGSEEIVTKESGDIDYEADISLKLWRKDKAERTATVYIDKCRNGETGKVILSFLPEYTRFENYTEKQEIERY